MSKHTSKTVVFISVTDEEKRIAIALKKVLEANFLDMVDVFVAFDPKSLPPGKRWIDEVTAALKRCAVEIIIASPQSVMTPWINFEAGCGWIRNIPVIPICHSQMEPEKLPRPLADLQSPRQTNSDGLETVVSVVANSIGCAVPKCDFTELLKVIRDYEDISDMLDELSEESPLAKTAGLAPHEIATLIALAEADDALTSLSTVWEIKNRMKRAGFTGAAVNLAVKNLLSIAFVAKGDDEDERGNAYSGYSLTDAGWNWVNSNQDKIRLRIEPNSEDPPNDEVFF